MKNGKSPNVSIEVKELPDATKCLHCDRTFPKALPFIGAPKDTEYIQLTGSLAQHLMQKHPLIAKQCVEQQMNMGIGISGLVVLQNFVSNDDGLAKWRDTIRHEFHEFSTAYRISDATIEEKVKVISHHGYGSAPTVYEVADAKDVIALVKEMRDILEERLRGDVPSLVVALGVTQSPR
jgi:hypothetical protein